MPEEEPPRLDPNARAAVRRLREVEGLTPEQLDELPFGAIKVDREGVVLAYNAPESRLSRRKPEEVVGRHFFTEVAPCTDVAEFAERFRKGIARGRIHETFPFVFTFPDRPVNVLATIAHEAPEAHARIFVDQSS